MKSTERGGRRLAIRVGAAALGAVAALTIAACGDSDDEGSATAEGGEVTIAQTSQPDFLDPALTYTANGIEPLWLVYTPLLTYRRVEGLAGAESSPGLPRTFRRSPRTARPTP
jgi:peptide/nickel transport system substrate-binding protein